MSYGPAVEDLCDLAGRVVERKPLRLHIIGADSLGIVAAAFDQWVRRHPDAEVADVKFSTASVHDEFGVVHGQPQIVATVFVLILYRESEDTPAEAGEEEAR